MRLGKKKEKDRDSEKEQFVEGISRLICSPNPKQSHPIPLRGSISYNFNFFPLSQHILNFLNENNYFNFQFTLMALNGQA